MITVSNDFTHAVAGSRLGTDFAQNKEVLVTEFVKYCSGKFMLWSHYSSGWSGGVMVLGKPSVPGRPTIWIQ